MKNQPKIRMKTRMELNSEQMDGPAGAHVRLCAFSGEDYVYATNVPDRALRGIDIHAGVIRDIFRIARKAKMSWAVDTSWLDEIGEEG